MLAPRVDRYDCPVLSHLQASPGPHDFGDPSQPKRSLIDPSKHEHGDLGPYSSAGVEFLAAKIQANAAVTAGGSCAAASEDAAVRALRQAAGLDRSPSDIIANVAWVMAAVPNRTWGGFQTPRW